MANLPPFGNGAPPSPHQYLQAPPFIPHHHPVQPPVMNYGPPAHDPNNNTFTRLIDQLNFSNMSLVNLTHQMTEMKSDMDNLNSRLNGALEEMRVNHAPPQRCSTLNGNVSEDQNVHARTGSVHGCEILEDNERFVRECNNDDHMARRSVTGNDFSVGNGRNEGEEVFAREIEFDNNGYGYAQVRATNYMCGGNTMPRNERQNVNKPERSDRSVQNNADMCANPDARGGMRNECYDGLYFHRREENPSDHRLTVSEVESAFTEFSGSDFYPVCKWIVDFEEMAETIALSEMRKFVVAKRKLVGLARMSLNSAHHITSWRALKDFLIAGFEHRE